MFYWIILKVALKSIWANKLRSILAMLGIIIGTGAVISMLALGAGAQSQVLDRVNRMGTNLLTIRPIGHRSAGVRTVDLKRLSLDDAQSIVYEIDNVVEVAPIIDEESQIKFYEENTPASVIGTSVT